MKRKLLLAALVAVGALGFEAKASVTLETDLTSQFNSLATNQWTNSSGQVTWAAPQVTTNSGLTVAAWERYVGNCNWTGDIMYTTVTGLSAGTYKIELYGAAAFTFDRGFGSTHFTGDFSKDKSDTYKENQSIDTNTGVTLYAETSEGTVEKEIPIWYAVNFNTSGISTVVLDNVVVGSNGVIKIGLSKTSTSTNWHVVQLKGVTATVDGATVISSLKTTANSLLNNATYTNVTGSERTNLQEAYNATPAAETQEAYESVISALNTAISAFENVDYAAYNALVAEKTRAITLGVAEGTVNGFVPTNATDAKSKIQDLMVAEYTHVTTNFSNAVSLGTWTTVNAIERNKQHWDGTAASTYSEQNEGWSNNSWSCSYSQNLTLPAGNYVFKVAGRKSSDNAVLTLTVKKGEAILGTVNDFPNGDSGKGIDTSGAANFGDGTYANDNAGRGWQWRYVPFTLADPATVNVAITASATAQYQWVGFCNATVQTDDADNVALMEALVALNSAKTAATLTKRTANVGDGIFKINSADNETNWNAYNTAKTAADEYTFTAESTADEVNTLATNLATATTAYSNFLATAPLSAPDADKRYVLTIKMEGKDFNDNAITFVAGGRNDMGLYGIKYLAPANAYMNQALKFTAIDGEVNTYKVSAINVETGEEQYLTTGTTYPDVEGNNNNQIRTTDVASKASWVKIKTTEVEGQFQLLNVSASNAVIASSGNNDMYTAGSANFTIAEATPASVTVSANAGKYGTVIFPFIPDVSEGFDGITFYSCASVADDVVQLEKITTPAANTPYIVKNEGGSNFSKILTGWGTAAADSYTADLLTGVYTASTVPTGSYVLQTQNEEQAFYKAGAGFTATAYKAYLTVPAQNPAKAFYFNSDDATAIEAISALTSDAVEGIYTIGGAKVDNLQKGLNIVKMQNGEVKKILVK